VPRRVIAAGAARPLRPGRAPLRLGALAIVCALAGCGSAPDWLAAETRLADLLHPARGAWNRPTATLDDERRVVLRRRQRARIVERGAARVNEQGRLLLAERLPGPLRAAERIVLAPQRRIGDERWEAMEPSVVHRPDGGWGPKLAVDLEVGRDRAGERAWLVLEGIAPPAETDQRIDVPALRVPERARLAFGIGIEPAAQGQGAVRFRLSACREEACEERFVETLDPRSQSGRGWQDRTVDLGDLAGSEIAFRFETRLVDPGPDAFSLPVWANPTVLVERERPPEAVNVILLSLDTLRADRLPTYGYPLETAPFLDGLARQGTVFDRFVAAATTTAPSHMTIFTSIEPSVLYKLGGLGRIWPRATTLAEALRAAGLETGAITENVVLEADRGFGRGFDVYLENKSAEVLDGGGDAGVTYAMAADYLRAHADRRFFLFLHTYQVHYPYVPEPGYEALFPEPASGHPPRPGLPPDRDPALYDREIRFLDDRLRELHGLLEELGLSEKTLLVITSDHGEEFLEHGGIGHAANVHHEVTHVPLVFVGPGVPAGRRVSQAFGHRDLMPTLLEWLGLPAPRTVRGRSFAALLSGEGDALEPAPVYTESWRRPSAAEGDPGVAVRLAGRKMIRDPRDDGVVYHYFDVAADPLERHDRYPGAGDEASDLKQRLDAYRREARVAAVGLRKRYAAAPEDREVVPEGTPDLLQEERLRALGYVE
jgi:arylsulfatase A-like enzyme